MIIYSRKFTPLTQVKVFYIPGTNKVKNIKKYKSDYFKSDFLFD